MLSKCICFGELEKFGYLSTETFCLSEVDCLSVSLIYKNILFT